MVDTVGMGIDTPCTSTRDITQPYQLYLVIPKPIPTHLEIHSRQLWRNTVRDLQATFIPQFLLLCITSAAPATILHSVIHCHRPTVSTTRRMTSLVLEVPVQVLVTFFPPPLSLSHRIRVVTPVLVPSSTLLQIQAHRLQIRRLLPSLIPLQMLHPI